MLVVALNKNLTKHVLYKKNGFDGFVEGSTHAIL